MRRKSTKPKPRYGINILKAAAFGVGAATMAALLVHGAVRFERTSAPVHARGEGVVVPRSWHWPKHVATKLPPPALVPAPALPAPIKKSTRRVAASRPAPVVTPSPGSSVEGFTPTTPSSGSSGTATGYYSYNWSGYLIANAKFTEVSGSWTATRPSGIAGTISADSTWIGIGGVSTDDLIQVGTQNIILANGQIQTSAFYEMLPAASTPIGTMTVSPGDSMSASITETGPSQWAVNIHDETSGQSFSSPFTYASSLSSAEWVEEDPSFSGGHLIPFDHFGFASFWASVTTLNGSSANLASGNAQPITMVNRSGQVMAQPTAVGADGASFGVNP